MSLEDKLKGASESYLLEWTDTALAGMMHHRDDFVKTGAWEHLGEIHRNRQTLNAVVDELCRRYDIVID